MNNQPRDAQGRFLPKNADPYTISKKTSSATSPLDEISHSPSLDQPLVSFSIQNPFKRVLYWLNDIRKKQTTTVELRIKIPLIALPVFLAVIGGAFQIFISNPKTDQTIPKPTPVVSISPSKPPVVVPTSRVGVIKATYQLRNLLGVEPLNVEEENPSSSDASSTISHTPTPVPYRYVLVERANTITFLVAPQTVPLEKYLNQRVLVTGLFDQQKNTLTIEKALDIELLP